MSCRYRGRYNPVTALGNDDDHGTPSARDSFDTVWTGSKMIVGVVSLIILEVFTRQQFMDSTTILVPFPTLHNQCRVEGREDHYVTMFLITMAEDMTRY